MGLDKKNENLESATDEVKDKKDINNEKDIKIKKDTNREKDAKSEEDINSEKNVQSENDVKGEEDIKSEKNVKNKKDTKSKKDIKKKNGKKKRDKKLVVVRVLLISMILLSLGNYFFDRYRYYKETKKIEALKEAARKRENEEREKPLDTVPVEDNSDNGIEVPQEPPYVSPIDFEYWKSVNPDVIGYIKVPGTNIDYPILYDAEDNLRYLHESIDGEQTVHGSIYLDQLAHPDFTGKNNLIYGHHMKDGSMFKDVVKYKDEKYLKKHKTVYIYLPDREIKLRAIAAFYGEADGSSRQVKFDTDEEFAAFVESRLSKAGNKQKLPEGGFEGISQLFCLVTCSYEFNNARTFLYCIKESDYDTDNNVIGNTENTDSIGTTDNTENSDNTGTTENTENVDNIVGTDNNKNSGNSDNTENTYSQNVDNNEG